MDNIEVEIRSFLTKEQYDRLLTFFTRECGMSTQDVQQTWYLEAPHDLRIFKNEDIAKIVLKKGNVHDEQREELEVVCNQQDFDKLVKIFSLIGFDPKIKWFRRRHAFLWHGITVTLDDTRGYGYIIELEQLSSENEVDNALAILKQKMQSLDVELTPREEFEQKFKDYAARWKELTN